MTELYCSRCGRSLSPQLIFLYGQEILADDALCTDCLLEEEIQGDVEQDILREERR